MTASAHFVQVRPAEREPLTRGSNLRRPRPVSRPRGHPPPPPSRRAPQPRPYAAPELPNGLGAGFRFLGQPIELSGGLMASASAARRPPGARSGVEFPAPFTPAAVDVAGTDNQVRREQETVPVRGLDLATSVALIAIASRARSGSAVPRGSVVRAAGPAYRPAGGALTWLFCAQIPARGATQAAARQASVRPGGAPCARCG